jgi:hypothetical protein
MSEQEETLPRATVQKIIKGESHKAKFVSPFVDRLTVFRNLDERRERALNEGVLMRKGNSGYSECRVSW